MYAVSHLPACLLTINPTCKPVLFLDRTVDLLPRRRGRSLTAGLDVVVVRGSMLHPFSDAHSIANSGMCCVPLTPIDAGSAATHTLLPRYLTRATTLWPINLRPYACRRTRRQCCWRATVTAIPPPGMPAYHVIRAVSRLHVLRFTTTQADVLPRTVTRPYDAHSLQRLATRRGWPTAFGRSDGRRHIGGWIRTWYERVGPAVTCLTHSSSHPPAQPTPPTPLFTSLPPTCAVGCAVDIFEPAGRDG